MLFNDQTRILGRRLPRGFRRTLNAVVPFFRPLPEMCAGGESMRRRAFEGYSLSPILA